MAWTSSRNAGGQDRRVSIEHCQNANETAPLRPGPIDTRSARMPPPGRAHGRVHASALLDGGDDLQLHPLAIGFGAVDLADVLDHAAAGRGLLAAADLRRARDLGALAGHDGDGRPGAHLRSRTHSRPGRAWHPNEDLSESALPRRASGGPVSLEGSVADALVRGDIALVGLDL